MDLNYALSAKPRVLCVISFCPLSASSSFSPSSLRSICRRFLGSGHKLRPPGLRSRIKCLKMGSQEQPSQLFFKTSMNSQPIFVAVIAVAVLSILSLAYSNYSKRKKNAKEESGSPFLSLFLQGRVILDKVIETWLVDCRKFHRETPVKESKAFMDEVIENICASADEEAWLQFSRIDFLEEDNLISKTVKSPGLDFPVSSAIDRGCPKKSEVMSLSSTPPPISESSLLQSPMLATEMSELQLEGFHEEIDTESPFPTVKVMLGTVSFPTNNAQAEVKRHERRNYDLGKVGAIAFQNGIIRESFKRELYTFYEANLSVTRSSKKLNGIRVLSSPASLLVSHCFSSDLRDLTAEGSAFSAQTYLHSAEKIGGKVPLACYDENSSGKRTNLGKVGGFPRHKERKILPRNNHKNFPDFSHLKGTHASGKHHPSDQFSAYNHFLRDGRLTDCIEVLERMERAGLLDMNKVYHAKFFKLCKIRKAVKEAFSFTKLIVNPTLSTFNMLMSVCTSSQDSEGAFQVLQLVKDAGFKADCKLYTTLISTCAKCGKVDTMFEVFHEMVNAKVEPNVLTYGALIDGCARAGQVAKAFGAYGIMRSKKVKPDRVVFNALITACGQSGAVDRAFDVLAEMTTETQPIDPDHVTVGALLKACTNASQVDRAQEAYKMIHQYNIKGTPEVYTIAVHSCSNTGDWEFACSVYRDMKRNGVAPDEVFVSALIDVAGHAGKLDAAFEILYNTKMQGMPLGIISYSSLMGACSNAKNWKKALELYEDIKSINLKPTVSTLNALITALCDGDQLLKAMEVFSEMKSAGLCPNTITYSILLVASEKKDDLEVGLMLLSQAKEDGVAPNLVMCRCLVGMCLRRFEKACTLGEPVLSLTSVQPHIENEWTSLALMIYRETIMAGVIPTMEVLSQVLRCLKLPHDASLKNRLIENIGVSTESTDASKCSNLCSLIDGFGEYDPRTLSLLEEAASLGIVPCASFKESLIVVDARNLQIHIAEVYLLTVLKGLKHRLAAGAKLPNITILLPTDKTHILCPAGEKTINLAGRISQAVAALLRRIGLSYQGNESYGKIRINGLAIRRWFQPKLASPFSDKLVEWSSTQSQLGKGISQQQRSIRTGNLSLE